jgi:glutaredoxin-related protein
MDEVDQIEIHFSNEEMADAYENLKEWLKLMRESGYSLEAVSEVMSTFSLIHAYTFADPESVDASIQSIKEKVAVNTLNSLQGEGIVH